MNGLKYLTTMLILLGLNVKGQNIVKFANSDTTLVGVGPFFSIQTDSTSHTDSINLIAHIYQNRKLVISFQLLLTNKNDSQVIRILQFKVFDSILVPNYPNQIDTGLLNNYKVTIVHSDSIQKQSPIAQELKVGGFVYAFSKELLHKTVENFAVHGTVGVIGQLSDNRYINQRTSQNYINTIFNVDINLYGIPLSMNGLNSSMSNPDLNKINNYRVSFNYEKFHRDLQTKMDKKIKLKSEVKLEQITPDINIKKLNKEYGKLKNEINSPDYLKNLEKNREILNRGVHDTAFRNTYTYQKALDKLNKNLVIENRLIEIETIKEKYLQMSKKVSIQENIDQININNPKGFKRNLKKFGYMKPGYSLLLNIKKLDLGTFNPNYNVLVLGGVSLNGFNLELNIGNAYSAFTWGKVSNTIINPFSFNLANERTVMGARVGMGRTEKMLLAITFLKAQNSNSGEVVDSNFINFSPHVNYVAGVDFRYKMSNTIEFGAEYARSLDNRYLEHQTTLFSKYESIIKGENTKYSNAWYAFGNIGFNETNTRLKISTRLVDPYFASYGAPNLRQDNFRIEGKIDQGVLKNQLNLSFAIRHDEDNIYALKQATTKNNTLIYSAYLKINKYPFLIATFSPSYQLYYNSKTKQTIRNEVKLYQLIAGYTVQNRVTIKSLSFSYSKQFSKQENELTTLSHVDLYNLNIGLGIIPLDLQLNSTGTYSLPYSGVNMNRILIYSANATKLIFKKKISITGGYVMQKDFSYEKRNIIQAGSSFSFFRTIKCTIQLEHQFISGLVHPKRSSEMNIGRISIIKSF